MRKFINLRQNNWSCILLAIADCVKGTPHQSLGILPDHTLSGYTWKRFNDVQKSTSIVAAVDDILKAHEAQE